MTDTHPNLALLERLFKLIPFGLASTKDLLADDFVWRMDHLVEVLDTLVPR